MADIELGRDLAGRAFRSSCYAPFTSMYLEPDGAVRACCMNRWQPLGTVGETSLRAIWHGAHTQRLRSALRAGDLSVGCEQCASHVARGNPEAAHLRVFDQFTVEDPVPPWPVNLELALSNTCNLQCVMCNGELSSAIRAQREGRPPLPEVYDDGFFADLDEFLPHLEAVNFLGGEPFLARPSLRVMERLVELGLTPSCSVTTNGTHLNPRVRRIIEALPMHVAVSIDGATAPTLEAIRVGVDHAQLVGNVEALRELTGAEGKGLSFSFSLMRQNWHELGAVLRWADDLDCEVHVNKVAHPGRFSLHHCAGDELEEILRSLEDEDRWRRPGLTRNRGTWGAELEWIRGLLHGRTPSTDSAVAVRPSAGVQGAGTGRDLGAEGVGAILTDGDLLIHRVEPVDLVVAGVRVADFTGRPITEVQSAFIAALGPVRSTDVAYHADGVQEITISFDDDPGTVLIVDMTAERDGATTWSLRPG